MDRIPCSYIPPGVGNKNYIPPQAIPSYPFPGSAPSTADFQPSNNLAHRQQFAPNTPQFSVVQQTSNRGPPPSSVSSPYRSGFDPNIPPYMHNPRWPPHFNPPAPFFEVRPRITHPHQSIQSPVSLSGFNASFPPPIPMVSAGQCTTTQGDCHSSSVNHCIVDRVEDKNADQVWIKSWLQYRSKDAYVQLPSIALEAGKLKLWKVKESLQDCWSYLSELEDMEKELIKNGRELSDVDWNRKLKEIDLKKVMFENTLNLINKNEMKHVKSVLSKRSKKRARERKRRQREKEASLMRSENRKKLHLETDMWLERQQSEVELLKQEESMKQEADAVLWGVRRKQSEGRKILSLLSVLVKLHNVRSKKKESSSNPAPSEDAEQFTKIIDKLVHLWEGQMKDYEAEEKTLRVMLQENPEKSEGKAPKEDLKHDLIKLERSNRNWEIALFGDTSGNEQMSDLMLDLFRPFFMQPNRTPDALIETRRHWDQFVFCSPSSSSIPIGWVMPKEASSKEWKEKTE